MKLDRNINGDKRGKYGLILQRRIREIEKKFGIADGTAGHAIHKALKVLDSFGVLDWGTDPETEFFVIRLKDRYADEALYGYAQAIRAHGGDRDFADDIAETADRAGRCHPNCKEPD